MKQTRWYSLLPGHNVIPKRIQYEGLLHSPYPKNIGRGEYPNYDDEALGIMPVDIVKQKLFQLNNKLLDGNAPAVLSHEVFCTSSRIIQHQGTNGERKKSPNPMKKVANKARPQLYE